MPSLKSFFPGFAAPRLITAVPLSPQVADLEPKRFGLELFSPEVRVLALGTDDRSLCIYNDTARTVSEIEKFSANDARSYPGFVESFSRIGRVLAPLVSMTPPSIDQPTAGELFNLGKVGLAFRGLGKKDEFRLLRWGPMAVADLVAEWFETELLRATVGAWHSRRLCWPMVSRERVWSLMASSNGRQCNCPGSVRKGGWGNQRGPGEGRRIRWSGDSHRDRSHEI